MQFKHPELLYALFLLLIPILIHLFQLRRFQKIDFTNVAFLKKVTIQTRKSSQLKKWLTLLARLLAMACLILAFAQPFTASKTALNTQKETVLYVDNSFSMQSKGSQGPLLQRALQDLFTQFSASENLSWFTNNHIRKNVSVADFKSEVLSVDYSQKQLTPEEVLLQANQLFSKEPGAERRLIYVSDFQTTTGFPAVPESIQLEAVQLRPVAANNITIDTAYVVAKNTATTQLKVTVSAQGDVAQSVPVSLFNNNTLIAKTAVDFSANNNNTVTFDIEDPADFNGRLTLNDANLTFDNSIFFSINSPEKIKVLSINESEANYLQRLFNQSEFDYAQQSFNSLNYNDLPAQNFIILNEVKDIPTSLTTALKAFVDAGGSLFVIPSNEANITSYNALLSAMGVGAFSEYITSEKKITQITFSHPLYADVFEKQVVNFQYPKVNSFFEINSGVGAALRFEDRKPFILQQGKSYVSTAPMNSQNSNFQNSPLIVPTLYNMAKLSLPLPELYYQIGTQNTFAVPIKLIQDEILTLKDSTVNFIPLQQTKANQVIITTTDEPGSAGTYSVENENTFIENVSYNYTRDESRLRYANAEDWSGVRVYNSIGDVLDTLNEESSINSFWKWFVIFALIFLVLEMLILKFYK